MLAIGFLTVHILTAVLGRYTRISLAAAIIPFASGYDPLWLGLGAVSFDLMVALIATSLLRRHISHRTWRAVHWLGYACWPAAMAHSIATGTGMRAGRLLDLAIACILAVLAASAWRLAATIRGPSVQATRRMAAPIRTRHPAAQPGQEQPSRLRLHIDPISCTGHGLCAELLPELIALDRWGYPLLADGPVPAHLAGRARRTVTDCPALALRLASADMPSERNGVASGGPAQ